MAADAAEDRALAAIAETDLAAMAVVVDRAAAMAQIKAAATVENNLIEFFISKNAPPHRSLFCRIIL